jgi:hypothetical protein
LILAALLEPDRILAREPAVAAILRRIQRDEAGHVRLSRRLAAAFARGDAIRSVAEKADWASLAFSGSVVLHSNTWA